MATSDMMQLEVTSREDVGKQAMKRLRYEGNTPGIIYGLDKGPQAVSIDSQMLENVILQAGGKSLLEVKVDGKKAEPVMVIEVQREILSRGILHVDFKRIDILKTSVFIVPIKAVGEALGIKAGGILNLIQDSIEVECLPTDLPDKFELDVSELDVGDAIYARDLVLADGVILKLDPNKMLVNIGAPIAEEVEEVPVLTEEELAAAEAAAAEEGEEPVEEGEEKKPEAGAEPEAEAKTKTKTKAKDRR